MSTQRPDDQTATTYQEQVRVAAVHATVFAIGITAITLINLIINLIAGLTGELSAWWSLWTLAGWGLGVTVHLLVVRLRRPRSSNRTAEPVTALHHLGTTAPSRHRAAHIDIVEPHTDPS